MDVDKAWPAKNEQVIARVVVLASADVPLRERLRDELVSLRWRVFETCGGAAGMVAVIAEKPEAFLIDRWLPDLQAEEFANQMAAIYSQVDVLRMDGTPVLGAEAPKGPRRHELLHAIREARNLVERVEPNYGSARVTLTEKERSSSETIGLLPEMIGRSDVMLELARMIQLVAPSSATVLIEGETGTGKEVVAKAVHRLSARPTKPFIVLNCAAIPESLLEAELFGHTRGAFTGAVNARKGRIETADGGTLFLDEIGELPISLQAKMLRFLECGELQSVGSNETKIIDVRVIAATHQPLEKLAKDGTFRLDLYHRLAVFPLQVPALRERKEDLPLLVQFFLDRMNKFPPVKQITSAAMVPLLCHDWPGNVRELMHVLERAAILSRDFARIEVEAIRTRATSRA